MTHSSSFLLKLGFEFIEDSNGLTSLQLKDAIKMQQKLHYFMTYFFEMNKDLFLKNDITGPILPARVFISGSNLKTVTLGDETDISALENSGWKIPTALLPDQMFFNMIANLRMPIGEEKTTLKGNFQSDVHHNLSHFYGFLKDPNYLIGMIKISREAEQNSHYLSKRSLAFWYYSEMLTVLKPEMPLELRSQYKTGPDNVQKALQSLNGINDLQDLKKLALLEIATYTKWSMPLAGAANDQTTINVRHENNDEYLGDTYGSYIFVDKLLASIDGNEIEQIKMQLARFQVLMHFLSTLDPLSVASEIISPNFLSDEAWIFRFNRQSGLFSDTQNLIPTL